ncbi:MAG TPA: L-fucose:H+ symporter permease [Pontiellaceae bacterium]|nr:L-fucose:H+ symporter permease [Pontiellaceae bacterium]
MHDTDQKVPVVSKALLGSFILVTSLFALWGFANDITNPLVRAFKEVFPGLTNAQSSWVQGAFYGGYATMAIPAALFIRRFSYKAGILLGLALYATGALLFIPAAVTKQFVWFPISLYVLTFGLAFLETTANPYILALGDEKTATRRLNLAQAFNPIGSLIGMFVASKFILAKLWVTDFRNAEMAAHPEYNDLLPSVVDAKIAAAREAFAAANPAQFIGNQTHDLNVIRNPYAAIGIVVLIFFVMFLVKKMPVLKDDGGSIHPWDTAKQLFSIPRWWSGVIAQMFYVAAQITCWTYVIHYAMTNVGMSMDVAQNYNIAAMALFLISRFICTFLLKYFSPGHLLMTLSVVAIGLMLGVIFLQNYTGLLCLIGVSGCMSLMFPTIYGIALDGMGQEAKLASAGLVFAIVGGAWMPLVMGGIIDHPDFDLGFVKLTSVSMSFVLPLISFVVTALYGYLTFKIFRPASELTRK